MRKFTLPVKHSFKAFITLLTSLSDEYEYFYRGCSEHNWKYNLIPGIYRPDNNGITRIFKEHINFKEMVLRSPLDFINDSSTLEKLVKMQHYRVPTRLLDITSNPLVALYFACETFNKDKPKNGKVYVFKIRKEDIKYYDSDAVCLISNLAKLGIEKTDFRKGFDNLTYVIKEDKPHFYDHLQTFNKEDIRKVFPVKVKLNNNRIVRQSGAFLIFGIRYLKSKEKLALPNYNVEKEIIINKESKAEILQLLDSLSINRTTLFPELEHQAIYLEKKLNN